MARRVRNAKVEGSIPFRSTNYLIDPAGFSRFLRPVHRATNVLPIGPLGRFVARHGRYALWIIRRRGKPALVYRPHTVTGPAES
jgi:hypothetical protein